jgi:DNA-binding FadR family transcriptional regulator
MAHIFDVAPRTEKRAEGVTRLLVNEIFSKGLEPGAKLPPEHIMLERFGVGRSTLREALRVLEVHGLITIRSGPGGGPVVARLTAQNLGRIASLHYKASGATVRDVWEARGLVEPMMARRVAESGSAKNLKALAALLKEAEAVSADDDDEYLRISSDFHRSISTMCGNPIIDLFSRSLGDITSYLVVGHLFSKADRHQVHADHVEILGALVARDGDRAEELMRAHMAHMLHSHAKRYPGMIDEPLPYLP